MSNRIICAGIEVLERLVFYEVMHRVYERVFSFWRCKANRLI
jgi:hypothetical protein